MSKTFLIRFLAVVIIVGALGTAGFALFRSSDKANQNLVFADNTMLNGLWSSYKTNYWESSTGRTLDKQQNNITTSEGQSYTLLRAVWESDKPTFDKSLEWTNQQLKRPDNLFSWRWGQRADGTYGIFTDMGGQNTATDADSDIALALLMAGGRWQQQSYIDEARLIIKSMYANEVVTVNGAPYVVANNLEKDSSQPMIINPSYLSPYAYREFAKVDTADNWNAVVDSSYTIINQSIDMNLDKGSSIGLPPNWITINRTTGAIAASTNGLDTNYGYDAIRTPWRLALDYEWNKDPRAKATLQKMSFLQKQWETNGKIDSVYGHDGTVVSSDEALESYGTSLGYFSVINTADGDQIYEQKIQTLYDQNKNEWSSNLTYYSDNWVWFGIGLYKHQLPNLIDNTK